MNEVSEDARDPNRLRLRPRVAAASGSSDTAELLRAIAALAWPILVGMIVLALIVNRRRLVGHLVRMLPYIRSIKFPWLEIELNRLKERTDEATKSVAFPQTVVVEGVTSEEAFGLPAVTASGSADARAEAILQEAANSPKRALMALSAEIEKKAREVLATSQDPSNWERRPLSHTLSRLDLSPALRSAVDEFRVVRNKIVHGHKADDDDVLRALDSGLEILRAIEALPREVHVVYEPNVEIFADSAGNAPRKDVHGVMLKSQRVSGKIDYQVFPTRRTHFQKGKPVAWEWDTTHVWPERGTGILRQATLSMHGERPPNSSADT